MSFLPIVERELRVRARQKSTYRFRVGGALTAIIIGLFLLATGAMMSSPGSTGARIFTILGGLIYLYCLFEGARNTADCLSEEKRAGTIGLLFLTDLKGYDVVLGKLMATSLNSFYALLAIFPPLAIPLVLGGVTGGEFWRLVLALTSTLFFSLAVGIFVSAVGRQERRTWGATVAIVGFVAVGVPLLGLTPIFSGSTLTLISPSTAFLGAFDAAYSSKASDFWWSIFWAHSMGWFSLAAASYLLPRTWQERSANKRGFWFRRLMPPQWLPRVEAWRRRKSRRLLGRNPVSWLAGRQNGQQPYLWALVILGGGTALTAWAMTTGDRRAAFSIFLGCLALHFVLAVWVASRACSFLAEARNTGTLELLLSTPVTAREILEGHLMALERLFRRPVLALVSVEVVLMAAQWITMHVHGVDPFGCFLVTGAVGLCLLSALMDLPAAAQYGMWMALNSAKPTQAFNKTVLFALVLPMAPALCCFPLWPLVGIVKNISLMNYARDQLRRQFRTMATERFAFGPDSAGWTASSRRKTRRRLPSVLPP